MSVTTEQPAGATDVRPFRAEIPDDALDDLDARLAATHWPPRELVDDSSQGVQLATMIALTRYWARHHDWRTFESRLNAVPQFKTRIDGLDIHFIHVRSPHADALPLIITHGWPGSIVEMLGVITPLTDPTADGGRAEHAFDVVVPSLPGYGFSEVPESLGWDPTRVAKAWAALMDRLGYTRYVAQGGDVGAAVTDTMASLAPDGLLGVHLNFLRRPPTAILAAAFGGGPVPDGLTETEREALNAFARQFKKGYIAEQGQSPQTIGYALSDSPAALAAWILDHDADAYQKISRAFLHGDLSGGLTPDAILDNITLYWLTRTGTSAARMYWEAQQSAMAAAGQPPPEVSLPAAISVFPGEIFRAPRSWAEQVYPNLVYFNEVERGGHFAAWEEPELFSEELRAAFRSLR